jgi:hypothetical protein
MLKNLAFGIKQRRTKSERLVWLNPFYAYENTPLKSLKKSFFEKKQAEKH